LTDLDARHSAAAQMHNAAMQRVRDLWSAAEKQKKTATEAALVGEQLLQKVSADGVDVTDDELLEAAEKARREEAKASIGEARVKSAMRGAHEAHIEKLKAERDILQETFDSSVSKLIAIGDHIDELRAALDDAIAAYDTQGQAVMQAHRFAHHHNAMEVGNEQHHHNPVLAALGPAEQPRVNVPQFVSIPSVKLELYENVGAGSDRKSVV
jgi:arginyl-tRNA synthetase